MTRWGRQMRGVSRWVSVAGLVVWLAGGSSGLAAEPPYAFHGLASTSPPHAADFSLTAHTGGRVRLSDFRGRTVLLYFGYTSCPGICPTTLTDVNQALKALGPRRARKVQFIMVTVDPERDTKAKLAAYLAYFNPSFLGATGTAAEIAAVAAHYGIYYRRIDDTPATGYLIDHTSVVIGVDERGYVRVLFPHGTAVTDMTADLAYLVR